METHDVFVGEVRERYVPSQDPNIILKEGMTRSEQVVDYLREIWEPETLQLHESFYVLYLSRVNRVIGWTRICSGGVDQCLADVKLIMRRGLLIGAAGIILSHNHPSGSTNPSDADRKMTKQIVSAGKLLCMKVLDHVIITADSHFSFAAHRILK